MTTVGIAVTVVVGVVVGAAVGAGVATGFSPTHPRKNNDKVNMIIEISFLLVIPHQ